MEPLDSRGARVAALDALSRRDYGCDALRRKLLSRGYDLSIVEPLIERLRTEKLIDEQRFLENFVAYHAGRGQGPHRVRAELAKLNMAGAEVEACIESYADWNGQLERARQKKFGTALPNTYADQQRQARFLGCRGFTRAQIRAVLGLDFDIDS